MTMAVSAPGAEVLRFAERLLGLLDQGQFTATYKYAVLLGLMDLCLEHTQKSGAPPPMVTTAQLADKVIELYWPQTRPFRGQDQDMLRQNTGKHPVILRRIDAFRQRHAPDASATLHRARLHAPAAYTRLLREVEWKLVEMPLPRLQRIGKRHDPFVYRVAWTDGVDGGVDGRVTRALFNDGARFDNRIHFVGAAAELLVRLAGLLRPLIQQKWAAMVARLNQDHLQDAALEGFLFGVDRRALEPVRAPLLALQAGRCFYCKRDIRAAADVDHFLPWARHPDNGLDNLVVAHPRCNRHKSDFLAAAEHVEQWTARNADQHEVLHQIARDRSWERDEDRTAAVVRGIYLRLPDDVQLWQLGRELVPADRGRLAAALAA